MDSTHSASSSASSLDSLFSEPSDEPEGRAPIASSETPPIKGLYIFKEQIPSELCQKVVDGISRDGYFSTSRDQVMLFTRPEAGQISVSSGPLLPRYLLDLLETLRIALQSRLSADAWRTVFDQPLARQVIINLYPAGEGISPHVDLPHRYADGVVGVSLFGSTTMTFCRAAPRTGENTHDIDQRSGRLDRYAVHLPPRSVYILTGSARYDYTHGIEGRRVDLVQRTNGRVDSVVRGSRLSVTYRWMKEDGDVLT